MPHGREREDGRALLAARLKELLAASGLQNKQAASKAGSYLGTGGAGSRSARSGSVRGPQAGNSSRTRR